MKFADFEYAAPRSIAEAIGLLASAPGEAKLIAGGQSLLPAMAFRLASPRLLVDLKNVPGLDAIEIGHAGLRIGARVRWRDIQDDARLRKSHPLLAEAISHVAHYQIRNRGTVGGSLAHADPAAEMPGIAVACDAVLEVAGPKGSREIAAADFVTGPLSTALADDEVILAVRFPSWPAGRRWAFREFAYRRGDFAIAAVAVHFYLDGNGRLQRAHIGAMGVADRPCRLAGAEEALEGKFMGGASFAAAIQAALSALAPRDDLHATGRYRKALFGTLLERALKEAGR